MISLSIIEGFEAGPGRVLEERILSAMSGLAVPSSVLHRRCLQIGELTSDLEGKIYARDAKGSGVDLTWVRSGADAIPGCRMLVREVGAERFSGCLELLPVRRVRQRGYGDQLAL